MGSVKAITSARLALNEETGNMVSLDEVIATMAQTGKEMSYKFKGKKKKKENKICIK